MKKLLTLTFFCFVSFIVIATGCKGEPAPVVETQPTPKEEIDQNMEAGKVPGG